MSEGAVVVGAAKARWSDMASVGKDGRVMYSSFAELEVPFNSSRKMMATVHRLQKENFFDRISLASSSTTFPYVALIKGAPDRVVQVLTIGQLNGSPIDRPPFAVRLVECQVPREKREQRSRRSRLVHTFLNAREKLHSLLQ